MISSRARSRYHRVGPALSVCNITSLHFTFRRRRRRSFNNKTIIVVVVVIAVVVIDGYFLFRIRDRVVTIFILFYIKKNIISLLYAGAVSYNNNDIVTRARPLQWYNTRDKHSRADSRHLSRRGSLLGETSPNYSANHDRILLHHYLLRHVCHRLVGFRNNNHEKQSTLAGWRKKLGKKQT